MLADGGPMCRNGLCQIKRKRWQKVQRNELICVDVRMYKVWCRGQSLSAGISAKDTRAGYWCYILYYPTAEVEAANTSSEWREYSCVRALFLRSPRPFFCVLHSLIPKEEEEQQQHMHSLRAIVVCGSTKEKGKQMACNLNCCPFVDKRGLMIIIVSSCQ